MRRVVAYLVISISVALLITGATFLVGEGVVAPVPGAHGAGTTATVSGFPIPYATFFPCCSGDSGPGFSVSFNNTYYYHPLSFVADFAIWLGISLAVVFTFSLATLALATVAGLGITLLTLLLPPLSIVRPAPGLETAVLRPMGFPYEYLTYSVSGLGGVTFSGYQFALPVALADYVLWTGVAAALIGITVKITLGRRAEARVATAPGAKAGGQAAIRSVSIWLWNQLFRRALNWCAICPS